MIQESSIGDDDCRNNPTKGINDQATLPHNTVHMHKKERICTTSFAELRLRVHMNIIIIMNFFWHYLSIIVRLLVTYCVQNIKRKKIALMLAALRVKKPSFVTSHCFVFRCIMLPTAGEPYFTSGFNLTHWIAVFYFLRSSSGKWIHPHTQLIRPTK